MIRALEFGAFIILAACFLWYVYTTLTKGKKNLDERPPSTKEGSNQTTDTDTK